MVVSRHVVDGVEIGGLIVSAVGVLCTTNGYFGKSSSRLARRSFAVFAIAGLFGIALVAEHSFTPQSALDSSMFGLPRALFYALGMVLALGLALWITGNEHVPSAVWASLHEEPVIVFASLFAALALAFGIALVTHETWIQAVVFIVVALLTVWTSFGLMLLTSKFDAPHVQRIGITLTLVGIATQFAPPVLNLLNIPVK